MKTLYLLLLFAKQREKLVEYVVKFMLPEKYQIQNALLYEEK